MKNLFPENLSDKDRRDNLQGMAHSVEETTYFKKLSKEDLEVRRETLTENVIKLSKISAEKKDFMASLKEISKPLVVENESLLTSLDTKHAEVEGVLYHVDDQEEGVMNTYDEKGEFIKSRRLRPNEKVASMFNLQISKEA